MDLCVICSTSVKCGKLLLSVNERFYGIRIEDIILDLYSKVSIFYSSNLN